MVPELLDGLPPDDPEARRSRWDLRLINGLMGNFRWVEKGLVEALGSGVVGFDRRLAQPPLQVIEIGAGEGRLCRKLSRRFMHVKVTGIDLAPRPDDLPAEIAWKREDLVSALSGCRADIVVGTMILHHFPDEELRQLGELLRKFPVICFCEPWRATLPHVWGGLMWPFIGKVTRHDMRVSIDAGFRPGELPGLLGLKNWQVRESVDWRGSVRLLAWRG
ncbi:MAG: class I SAM-dependent methyltransferase [Terrimicrobiaceae bacterium]